MGTILETIGTIGEGQAAKAEGEFLEQQHKRNAQLGKIKANQTEAFRRTELRETLGTIDAVRASRGVSATSPTGVAIRRGVTDAATTSLSSELLNIRQGIESSNLAARFAKSRGNSALTASGIRAGASVFKAAERAASAGLG